MAVLQIVADQPGAGKTSLAAALLLHSVESGIRAAYYKPFSTNPREDPDVALITQSLFGANPSPPPPSSHPFPPSTEAAQFLASPAANEMQQAVTRLREQYDLVLLESPNLTASITQTSLLPLQLSSLIDSKVLLLFRFTRALKAHDVQQAAEPFTNRLAGVLINGVTAYRKEELYQTTAAALEPQDIPFLGTLGETRGMFAVTVKEIADYLGGHWVRKPENTEACIERFLIGNNIMDLGPTYFGRFANQAVIVRANRPDIQMASLMSETRCLILTGGDEPSEYVKAEALQREVPLILVGTGTLETAEVLGGILDYHSALNRRKIKRFLQLLRCNVNLDALCATIG